MRGRIAIQAALVAVILSGGAGPSGPHLFGIRTAEAKDYYTRKRVNGRWITGRFPKRSAAAPKEARREAPTKLSEAPPVPAAPPSAAPAVPAAPVAPVEADALKEQNRLAALKRALEQRARSMATGQTTAPPQVRSVTYDFDKGRKTIIHLDGTVTEEPLDPVATGQVTARP